MRPRGVLGVYGDLDIAADAIRELRKGGYRSLSVLSPAPHHELELALEGESSKVKWFTLVGAFTGLFSAIALTVWTSVDWPLVSGGKPVPISPGYFVIMFEMTVLFAAIFTVTGFIVLSRLPHTRLRVGYDPRFSDHHVGIWLPVARDRADAAARALQATGAEDVRIETR